MSNPQRSRVGRSLTLQEHQKISTWNDDPSEHWPRIELALNYPHTPEMLGVVEHGQVGPTLFVWASDGGIVVEPFSGGSIIYLSLEEALSAIARWADGLIKGQRVPFTN